MKTKIEIKDISGNVLFTHECGDNSVKKTLEEAVRQRADLREANLNKADLSNADLKGAILSEASLNEANLNRANLIDANLKEAYLCEASLHETYLCEAYLQKAYLSEANLTGAKLCNANLREARLCGADLKDANLSGADLSGANLSKAHLNFTDFYFALMPRAILSRANFEATNLCGAFLRFADLDNTDLHFANLNDAFLDEAKNVPFYPLICPSDGAFIGWKKVNECLVKLLIPEDAKRSSDPLGRCRCDKAKVLEITNLKTNEHLDEITDSVYDPYVYKVAEMVYADSFSDNWWDDCPYGIYFFINRQEAVEY